MDIWLSLDTDNYYTLVEGEVKFGKAPDTCTSHSSSFTVQGFLDAIKDRAVFKLYSITLEENE